jgi:hypothetical protein
MFLYTLQFYSIFVVMASTKLIQTSKFQLYKSILKILFKLHPRLCINGEKYKYLHLWPYCPVLQNNENYIAFNIYNSRQAIFKFLIKMTRGNKLIFTTSFYLLRYSCKIISHQK